MRIFLDANILFSAARSDGAVRRLLEDLRQAGHQCVADGYVTGEARRNLEIKCPSALSSLSPILEHVDACRHVVPSACHQQIQLLKPLQARDVQQLVVLCCGLRKQC